MADKRLPPPLDEEALRELALRYVGRFATSRAKLLAYLNRKVKERGWGGEGPADPQALVDRLSELRYVDDAGYAVMKSGALSRRGYGARRVAETLRADGIAEADREEAQAQTERDSWSSADRFARRKRIGPYALERPDPKQREKWIAAFLRAGHDYATARRWTDAAPGEMPEAEG
ncbi:regulatory protein RecX [Sphingobium indicum IP26]|uniref:RecX family transcriptional regulator n=1 Tax=Sphingobium indicum F2 TaxID=1450518 RepID=A0A8E0WR64_9SPHN|nr:MULTISPECIES: RecX family transcriptional regulator [Sphingobium]EPR18876.1 regulatory protein RecX [Sphingobium indicum IP26]EQA97790.1 regulatory protein RecX [Sphingobium sp. HDIP04]KER35928.1 RecX family transcriptional regulator [Sphingobium indicum F2]